MTEILSIKKDILHYGGNEYINLNGEIRFDNTTFSFKTFDNPIYIHNSDDEYYYVTNIKSVLDAIKDKMDYIINDNIDDTIVKIGSETFAITFFSLIYDLYKETNEIINSVSIDEPEDEIINEDVSDNTGIAIEFKPSKNFLKGDESYE